MYCDGYRIGAESCVSLLIMQTARKAGFSRTTACLCSHRSTCRRVLRSAPRPPPRSYASSPLVWVGRGKANVTLERSFGHVEMIRLHNSAALKTPIVNGSAEPIMPTEMPGPASVRRLLPSARKGIESGRADTRRFTPDSARKVNWQVTGTAFSPPIFPQDRAVRKRRRMPAGVTMSVSTRQDRRHRGHIALPTEA